jgi:L-alanine-DL-glutamate epimerase-like enolase superfamily enzyme
MEIRRRDFISTCLGGIILSTLPDFAGSTCSQGNSEAITDIRKMLADLTITKVESVTLTGKRPHVVGRNSHLGIHGQIVKESVVRLTTNSGSTGWGHSRTKKGDASMILGKKLADLFDPENGTKEQYLRFDFPLWDLAGRISGTSVHQLLGDNGCNPVPVYDGSIYFDDLDPETGADRGIRVILDNVENAVKKGFRAFKLKVGRGYKWMEKKAGLERDLEVILAVRELVGPEMKISIDSNIGYTLVEAMDILSRADAARIYFIEETFPENRDDFVTFKRFLRQKGSATLIALGENAPGHEERFMEFIKSGLVDVVQWDMRDYTLSRWLRFLPVIERSGTIIAPHNWYSHLGGFYIAQFARGCPYFGTGEIDSMEMPGITSTGYGLTDGYMSVPDSLGFGLELDEGIFSGTMEQQNAWTVTL